MCYVQLRRLQLIHSRNFIHRDIKPSNIAMGIGDQANVVYLIDFGLSKEYRDPNTREHIPYNDGLGFIGTTTFASTNSHLGSELGRRDDLESLAYTLFYFLWGFLPWQGLRKGEAILECKRTITTHDLFLDLPVEFHTFFEHCRSLSFDEKPNYDYFYDLFGGLLLREGFQLDTPFDWDVAGGKNQQGGTNKSEVPRYKRDHSPRHATW
jgi:serine/threonine protein kinase